METFDYIHIVYTDETRTIVEHVCNTWDELCNYLKGKGEKQIEKVKNA